MQGTEYLFIFFLGLCVGSFVNVLVFRFGFAERPQKRSRCMACDTEIAWYDLLPVISFFALGGRCRHCGSGLSIQYPLVELSTATLFTLAFALLPPALSFFSLLAFLSLCVFLAAFVGLVAYDMRHTLVPMPFLWWLIASASVASISQSIATASLSPLLESGLGAVALFCFFMLIVAVTRGRGMGAGDAYVGAAIGILLGFTRGIEAVMVGVWTGAVVGLLMLFAYSIFP
ncbi:MAG: prepilin peptidase, partial [Patescibacteria group bacterium]|nr:prepilin peptidase [Patescibacteria group bacterium]